MSRETIYHCDGPDCATWIQTNAAPPTRGWLTVEEREGVNLVQLDFCGWSCLLRRAAGVEPEQVIAADL